MRAIVACLVLVGTLLPGAAGGGPLTQDVCPGSVTGPDVFVQIGNDTLENLLFSDGSLWVSDGPRSAVLRLDADGNEVDAVGGIPSPGGLARGDDGLVYAGWGNRAANAVLRTGEAKVVTFDPDDVAAGTTVYAEGLHMPNGMTFAPGGDLFVSNDFGYGPVRIPRDDPSAWREMADVWGANGLVVDPAGENLYAAITFDQRSPIERIPLDDPASHETFAQLSFGVVSLEPGVHTDGDPSEPLLGVKGLDDMTRDTDGTLYVTANGTGELLAVDANGQACLVASGFRNPSSVRIAPAGSAFDTSGEALTFYVTEFSGAIRVVGFTPA